ncbi:MAG: transposase, partial [Desulfobacteraceae bacterium]|nr:transposase [Desulfobacteraceae bacterium]
IDISYGFGYLIFMARMARVVAEGMPHHITQRGNRRQPTFFSDDDYKAYIDLMAEWCGKYDVDIWAYCLMPNHIHLVAVPSEAENLRLSIGEAHRRYTRRINFSKGWRGHLWQERFSSFVMDERYLLACARYIENNPVLAKLTKSLEQCFGSYVRKKRFSCECGTSAFDNKR